MSWPAVAAAGNSRKRIVGNSRMTAFGVAQNSISGLSSPALGDSGAHAEVSAVHIRIRHAYDSSHDCPSSGRELHRRRCLTAASGAGFDLPQCRHRNMGDKLA
jgi:hypothetical protein